VFTLVVRVLGVTLLDMAVCTDETPEARDLEGGYAMTAGFQPNVPTIPSTQQDNQPEGD
jgi:hypothetical protein